MAFGWNRTLLRRGRNEQAAPQAAARAAADDWSQPLPTPDVREGGESMWDAWHEESRRMDLAFADTQPSNLLPLMGARDAPPDAGRLGARWTADDVIALARQSNRVCPRPFLWSGLYVLLEGDRHVDLRPPPVEPWQWAALSNLQRRLRFREHIEWAERHGKLEAMARFLETLAEPDWVHMGED
jgi:hypothetical protein